MPGIEVERAPTYYTHAEEDNENEQARISPCNHSNERSETAAHGQRNILAIADDDDDAEEESSKRCTEHVKKMYPGLRELATTRRGSGITQSRAKRFDYHC